MNVLKTDADSRRNTYSSGFIMPVLLFTVTFLTILITIVASLGITNYNLATRESYKVNAQLTADAGLDAAINELNLDQTWTSSGGEVTLLDTPRLRTTYQTELLPGAGDTEKVLSVIARAYSPSTDSTPKITRRYELDIRAVTTGFGPSSVAAGVGGIVLNNNAKITGGDVVVNGTISMGNNAQIGTQSNAVNVRVAYHACPQPADSTYPRACTSGEPISMGSTAKIYGSVHANHQTSHTSNMLSPGLEITSGVEPVNLTEFDRSTFTVATELSSSHSTIACGNNQTKTWPANVKIIGDVNLGNNCQVTLSGNVWITGSLNTGNNGKLIVADTLGTTRPVIMIDGPNGFKFGNNGEIRPNSSNTGAEVYTFWSHSSSGCGADCTNLTGAGLANSQNVTTINLSNNGNAAYSVFTAQWSRVSVSNNGTLGAVAGQSIQLGNNAVINFTASIPGSDNLTTTWVKRGYIRVFN